MKRGWLVLLLALGAAGGFAAWRWLAPAQTAPVFQGYAEADYVRIGPTQAGLLVSLYVARGDQVVAGAPLFVQDEVPDRAARDQARASLAEAEAKLANLQNPGRSTEIAQAEAELADLQAARDRIASDLQRNEILLRTGAASRQIVDQQRADLRSAIAKVEAAAAHLQQLRLPMGRQNEILAQQAAVETAKAVLAQAEWRLGQRRVAAPASGRIADTYAQPGEMLAAGAPVVSLLPPENILVRFFVPEPMLARLHRGEQVLIGCDSCPPDLSATVSFIAPQPEYTPPVIYSESTRGNLVYLVEARPPRERAALLKPGQPVDVRLVPSGVS